MNLNKKFQIFLSILLVANEIAIKLVPAPSHIHCAARREKMLLAGPKICAQTQIMSPGFHTIMIN